MLSSFLKSSSLERNTFTQVVFPSILLLLVIDVPFRLTSQSVGGPSPTESASCRYWCGCVELVEAKMGSGMRMSALGHFKLEKKIGQECWLAIMRASWLPFIFLWVPWNGWGQNWALCFLGENWEYQGLSSGWHHDPPTHNLSLPYLIVVEAWEVTS